MGNPSIFYPRSGAITCVVWPANFGIPNETLFSVFPLSDAGVISVRLALTIARGHAVICLTKTVKREFSLGILQFYNAYDNELYCISFANLNFENSFTQIFDHELVL